LAVGLIILGIYVAISENVTLPGRVSLNKYYIEASGTYFLSASLFCFAATLILLSLKQKKYNKLSGTLFVTCFVLFSIGFSTGIE